MKHNVYEKLLHSYMTIPFLLHLNFSNMQIMYDEALGNGLTDKKNSEPSLTPMLCA